MAENDSGVYIIIITPIITIITILSDAMHLYRMTTREGNEVISMDVKIGTRKLQKINGAFTLNVPMYVVRTLGLQRGDVMGVTITDDGALHIEKEKENNPVTGAELAGTTPATGTQHTHGAVADVIRS